MLTLCNIRCKYFAVLDIIFQLFVYYHFFNIYNITKKTYKSIEYISQTDRIPKSDKNSQTDRIPKSDKNTQTDRIPKSDKNTQTDEHIQLDNYSDINNLTGIPSSSFLLAGEYLHNIQENVNQHK